MYYNFLVTVVYIQTDNILVNLLKPQLIHNRVILYGSVMSLDFIVLQYTFWLMQWGLSTFCKRGLMAVIIGLFIVHR